MVSRLKRDIVPIEEWIDSPYYLGPEAKALFPFWREHVVNYFNGNDISFIFHGSYSLGKTYVSLIMLLRLFYEMSCIEELPSLFGLSPSSKIMIAFVSVSASKAKSSGIGKLLRMFDEIPYFQDHCPRNTETTTRLDLGFIEAVHASNVGHLIAEDFYGVIFDEANFVKAAAGEEYEKAKILYLEARIRGKSRFSVDGVQHGFYGLLSSANVETSFTEQEIKRARKAKDTYVVEAATYDVKPEAYSKVRFPIFTGYDEVEPFIIDEATADVRASIAKAYGQTFDNFIESHPECVVRAPDDLRQFYQTDILYSLKALSGKTVRGTSKLLKNPAILDRAFKDNSLVNPLSVEIPTLSLFSDDTITDFLDLEKLQSNYEDDCKLYIHMDLSVVGDKTGFSAVYKSAATGKFRTLLIMAIHKKKESDEIDLSKVEDVVHYLADNGFSIGFVSYDQYASRFISQNMKKRFGKDKTDQLSLDKDDSHYLLVLFLLKKGLVESYYYRPLDVNFKNLDHDRASQKVDHPPETEKDVCLAGGTLIRLLDGTVRPIESLVGRGQFWVYSMDSEGKIRPGLAQAAIPTSVVPRQYEVTLDNGRKVTSSGNHLWMRRDGSFSRADELAVGDSLMPLYRHLDDKGYERVQDADGTKVPTHRRVSETLYGRYKARATHAATLAHTPMATARREVTLGMLLASRFRGLNNKEFAAELGLPSWTIEQLAGDFRRQGFVVPYASTASSRGSASNHKIKAIRVIDVPVQMFDIVMDQYHNFALDAGVFVHNCDAWAGGLSTAYRLEGLSREEIVANQMLSPLDESDLFFDDLIKNAKQDDAYNWFAEAMT